MTYDEYVGAINEEGLIPTTIWNKWHETDATFDAIVLYKDGQSETYTGVKGIVTAKMHLTIKYHDKRKNVRIKLEEVKGVEITNYKLFYPNRED